MRNKANVINTIPPSIDYPFGRLKDDTGTNDGTPICEENNGDIQETVTFFMNRAKITPNGLPDNVSNGYQIADAILEVAGKHDLIKNCEFIGANLVIGSRIDNMVVGEYLIQRFTSSSDTQPTNGITKIKFVNDPLLVDVLFTESSLRNNSYLLIRKTTETLFSCTTLVTGVVLQDVYDKIDYLESRPRKYVLPLNPTTIPSNTSSIPFTLPLEVFQNILSWEIVWELYYTDAGNSLVEYQSNKNMNMATGNSIMLGRFTNQQTTGFVRFQGFQGVPLANPKLIITYQPQ